MPPYPAPCPKVKFPLKEYPWELHFYRKHYPCKWGCLKLLCSPNLRTLAWSLASWRLGVSVPLNMPSPGILVPLCGGPILS